MQRVEFNYFYVLTFSIWNNKKERLWQLVKIRTKAFRQEEDHILQVGSVFYWLDACNLYGFNKLICNVIPKFLTVHLQLLCFPLNCHIQRVTTLSQVFVGGTTGVYTCIYCISGNFHDDLIYAVFRNLF